MDLDSIRRTLRAGPPDEPTFVPRPIAIPGAPRQLLGPAARATTRLLVQGILIVAVAVIVGIVLTWRVPNGDQPLGVGGLPASPPPGSPSPEMTQPCEPGDIRATFVRSDISVARQVVWVRLDAVGPTGCLLGGELRVEMFAADGRLLLASRLPALIPSGGLRVYGLSPGSSLVGEIVSSNWCGDAGPPPYQLQLSQGPWHSDRLPLDQLAPCIDAAQPLWIGDVIVGSDVEAPLPTVPEAVGMACRGVGVEGVLAGDATDARMAWLQRPDGRRTELVWPAHYRARFSPDLEVLDGRLEVVMRAGDPIHGGCVTRDPDVLLVMPPFR